MSELGLVILFSEKIKAVTPGQSAVVYHENRILAGGIIKTAIKNENDA